MPKLNFDLNPEFYNSKGWGHQGFCLLCSLLDQKLQKELNHLILASTASNVNKWLVDKGQRAVNRQTIYKHKNEGHGQGPKTRLVSAVQRNQSRGLSVETASTDDFLSAVVTAGAQKVASNPDDVSISDALRAAQIQKADKNNNTNILNQFIAIFAPRQPALTAGADFEGEYTEVS